VSLADHAPAHAPPNETNAVARRSWIARFRDRLTLPVGIAVASIVIIALNAILVVRGSGIERAKVLASVNRENSNLAVAFEQYVARTLEAIDTAAHLVARHFAQNGTVTDLAGLSRDHAIGRSLVGVVSIVDERGTLVASTDDFAFARGRTGVSAGDFALHAAADIGSLHIGVPQSSDVFAAGSIPITRRVNHADGTFAGVVLLQVDGAILTGFYDKVPRRPNDVLSLVGLDGIVRARQLGSTPISADNLKHSSLLEQQSKAVDGEFTAKSPIDGVRRLISYRTMENFPLIVATGVAEADAFAAVLTRTRGYYRRAAVLTALITTFAFLLVRALHRREKALELLRASQAQLQAREEELRTITESVPQLVWITDAAGAHVYFNQQWIDYTGLSLEQSIGDGWKAAFDPGEQALSLRRWRDAVARGEIYEAEYRLRRADGVYRWMLGRALPLRDPAGQIIKWFGTSTDIHAQFVAQAQLREAQEVAHVGSWSRDAQTGEHTWSDELYHIFGVQPGEFVPSYDSIAELIHPDDLPQYSRDRELRIASMDGFERDLRIVWKDGRVRTVRHSVAVDLDESSGARRVHGTVQDVTDTRAAEERVREQANLLNLTRDAIIVREADGKIRFWNYGAERLYGWTAEEVVGRRSDDFAYPDSSKFLNARRLLAENGEWSGELDHLRKDGSVVTVNSRWTLVPGELGKPSSVLVINTDVTEHKRMEGQILRTQRLESVGTLASGVAHDLNNILAPILMAAPLLRDDMAAAKRHQLVSLLEQSAERGAAIVRQVLTFARGADGARVLVQPMYALKDIATLMTETFPKSITIETTYPEDLYLIEADPTQLHQVLLNLCVNARDAMPDGGLLSINAENFEADEYYAAMSPGLKAGSYLLLEISDTGTGIPPDVMDKIFDPFFTTKGIGSGTGLGLSTVLGIVKDYGGTINAESSPRGTTFRILFPASRGVGEDCAPAAELYLPRGQGETILVVDDEDAILAVAEPLLRKHGYEVLVAEDGPAALTVFAEKSEQIDLVLTDLAMPIMSGISLARTLRKMRSDVRIIISAGREDDCDPAEMDEIGVIATLPKPYTQAALLRLLDQVLSPNRKPL
jgi:PAS domain S-box-containing protein